MSRSTAHSRVRTLAGAAAAVLLGLGSLALTAGPADAHGAWRAHEARYVALGDSYASGEGLAPYEAGTDTTTNRCHRSQTQSYPEVLEHRPVPRFDRLTSVACSGAITGDLFANLGGSDAAPQLAALSRSTRTVTVTIGGNDAGFAPVVTSCIYSPGVHAPGLGEPGCRERLDAQVSAAIAFLAGGGGPPPTPASVPIGEVVAAIHARAPHARIYVTGYPSLFGDTMTGAAGCLVGVVGDLPLYVTEGDAAWIATKAADLDAAIRTGVRQARRSGVDARYVGVIREFAGHEVCDEGTPWINGVVASPTTPLTFDPSSLHPTARGQRAYADSVERIARS